MAPTDTADTCFDPPIDPAASALIGMVRHPAVVVEADRVLSWNASYRALAQRIDPDCRAGYEVVLDRLKPVRQGGVLDIVGMPALATVSPLDPTAAPVRAVVLRHPVGEPNGTRSVVVVIELAPDDLDGQRSVDDWFRHPASGLPGEAALSYWLKRRLADGGLPRLVEARLGGVVEMASQFGPVEAELLGDAAAAALVPLCSAATMAAHGGSHYELLAATSVDSDDLDDLVRAALSPVSVIFRGRTFPAAAVVRSVGAIPGDDLPSLWARLCSKA